MVYYNIDDVIEGMVIGQSIYNNDKKLVIAAGFRLKQNHIDLLKKWGYKSIQISIAGTDDILPESVISDHVNQQLHATVSQSEENAKKLFQNAKKTKEKVLDIIKGGNESIKQIIRNSGATEVINKAIDDIMGEPWTVANLMKMQQASSSLFEYSINVTINSLCIGKKYHYSYDEMRQLGLGAINYDIGMVALPEELLNKEDELTAQEKTALQQHTVYGYLMLSGVTEIPPTSSAVALAHHEQQDGLGLPRGLKGDNRQPTKDLAKDGQIPRFAEIVAVADTYDMLINGRKHYSKKLSPVETVKKLIAMAGTKLNAHIVKTLLSITPIYPVGARIKIVNCPNPDLVGSTGAIAKIDPDHIVEPLIVIYESKHHKSIKPIKVDLSKHKGFSIELL